MQITQSKWQFARPGTSSLAPFTLITPAGESNVPVKVPRPDGSIRNDIPYDVNSMEYPVNVWSKLAQQIHHPGQFLTAEGLNAGTDHAVAAKQLDESLHVHALSLRWSSPYPAFKVIVGSCENQGINKCSFQGTAAKHV